MEGLIYRVQPYQENARLLFVYTPKGKKTLLAQGSQKMNQVSRVLSQFLTHIEFKDSDKTFVTLAESKIINDFSTVKNDFHQTKSAALILEIIDQLIVDNYNHQVVFHEMMLALTSPRILEASISFALKILKPLGYPLDLSGDGRKIKGVNIDRGGLIYQGELDYLDLDVKDTITLLKLSLMPYTDLEALDIEILSKIKAFILKYYQFHLQTTLKNLQ
ncbi:MAG: DNA repair protein RecO [Acholeplasmataceae bacterium]|nr:DNA repair protein RecO [Acholeplasmataceae bacterium]